MITSDRQDLLGEDPSPIFTSSVLGLNVILEAALKVRFLELNVDSSTDPLLILQAILSVYTHTSYSDPGSYWDAKQNMHGQQADEKYWFEERSALQNLLPKVRFHAFLSCFCSAVSHMHHCQLFCLRHYLESNDDVSAIFNMSCRQNHLGWHAPGDLTEVSSIVTLVSSISACRVAVEFACRNAPDASLPAGVALTFNEWASVEELAFILTVSQPTSRAISPFTDWYTGVRRCL